MPNFEDEEYNNDDLPVFQSKRATATIKHRRYRADKRHPKKLKIVLTEDLGKIEQIQQFYFEENKQVRSHKKQKNPNLVYLLKSPIKIVHYVNSRKTYLYSNDGLYLGELEKHDLKRLFSIMGLVLRGKLKTEKIFSVEK